MSIYGPGKEARHGPLSFYGQLIEKCAQRRKWQISRRAAISSTTRFTSATWRARFISPLKAPTPKDWTFNIGTGKASTPREFLHAAAKLFPNHKIKLGPGPSKLGRSKQSYCVFDISAAKNNIRL